VVKKLAFDFYSSLYNYGLYVDNVKIGNLKKKNRDHKKVLKQDEDAVTCKFYYI